jgi:uncharacterized protein involved in cysteine biosynthesis
MKIKGKKLKKKSLFKLIFVSMLIPMGLFCLLCGIAALFGAQTVSLNGEHQTGWIGLVAALVMFPFFVFIFTCFMWVGAAVGLWMYSWFKEIEIELVDAQIVGSSESESGSREH